jgi:hypothetical protein
MGPVAAPTGTASGFLRIAGDLIDAAEDIILTVSPDGSSPGGYKLRAIDMDVRGERRT